MIEGDLISYNKFYKFFIEKINADLSFNLKYDDTFSLDIYPHVPTLSVDSFRNFKKSCGDKKVIFYHNWLPSSGQKFPIKNVEEHNEVISFLALENIVLIADKKSYIGNNENVYFADDFVENVEYYDAKNFYYHAQMAYESDYAIYYDSGRNFMYLNKTFIEDNNKNKRLHLGNTDYYYDKLNRNSLVPIDYAKFIMVSDLSDIISELTKNIYVNDVRKKDVSNSTGVVSVGKNLRIEYGTDFVKIDVTKKCFERKNRMLYIPRGDEARGKIFGDPIYGFLKQVYIVDDKNVHKIPHDKYAYIDIKNSKMYQEFTYLSVMAIFKNETMNLKIWLDHYLWQGVEHFYLIDNGSTDNPLEILQDYMDNGLVTYYYRPEKHCQVEHYRYVYDVENIREKTEWFCICDLDEFFFGTEKKLTSTLMESFNNFDVIYKTSHFYGSDNLIDHPKDIRTSIIHRQEDLVNGIKYIFRPHVINDSSEIWIHWLLHSGTINRKILDAEAYDNEKKIRLNHYNIQSLEYFKNVKMTRGDVNVSQHECSRDMDYFEHYQRLSIIKDDALKLLVENNIYELNGESMKFYDENNTLIDNNVIEKCEQDLAKQYILEDDVVLELGARYGSVSCAINKKLKNKLNQISVEPDKSVWNALEFNKIKNNCNFHIVKGFISNKKLDLELSGYAATFVENEKTQIKSYSLEEIKKQVNISKFSALVADCEGFLEIFFDENPELYDELRIIIFEADCQEKCNYEKIKQELFKKNFVEIIEGPQNVWMKKCKTL